MSDYDNTNTFALFKNKDKEEGSKQPDYRGTLNVDGVEKEIAAWIRVSAKGEKFMSGRVNEPYKKEEKASPRKFRDEDADSIPF